MTRCSLRDVMQLVVARPHAGLPQGGGLLLLLTLVMGLAGCSMGQIAVRGSMPLMAGGLEAMNRETDLTLAREAMPTSLMLLEGMLVQDPNNSTLHLYVAQGFYGYSYAFVEREDPTRAGELYARCQRHAQAALAAQGFTLDIDSAPLAELERALQTTDRKLVPALFWAASCSAKRLDVDRTDPQALAQLTRAASLMQRVLELDENYYHAGPHLFFGVYYGGRAPMFGGDFERAAQHFAKARALTEGKLLMVDLLYAEYLARQQLDQSAFHARLTAVLDAPDDLYPAMALANQIAKQRARWLLGKEKEWF